MRFIKAHLVSLICGVAALGFIAVGAIGMTSTGVRRDMEQRLTTLGASQIASLQSSAKNQKVIDAEKAKGDSFQREYEETLKAAYAINRREVLMPGVFPTPERMATPFEFADAYKKAIRALPRRMDGGTLPTAADVAQEATEVEELRRLDLEREQEGGAAAPAITTDSPSAAATGGGKGGGGGGMMGGGPAASGASDPRYDPLYRARISKAKSIRVYYDEPGSLDVSPVAAARETLPTVENMWYAQVGYWIQQDVIEAIRDLNAEIGKAADGDVGVGDVPVKHLVRIRVLGYQLGDNQFVPQVAGSEGLPGPSFTGRKCNEQFDVVRFTVEAVVDQRDVNKLVDRICRKNFYQLLNIELKSDPAVRAQDEQAGYLYGPAPVVDATLDFEGYMARAVYKPLMPKPVIDALAGQPAQP